MIIMKYRVTTETSLRDRPKDHEMMAAIRIAEYFKTDILFLRREQHHSPDLDVNGALWELKSPIGDGKNTIKNNLHAAKKQTTNVILDLSRCKMYQDKALANVRHYFADHRSQIKHLIIITKRGKVVELF